MRLAGSLASISRYGSRGAAASIAQVPDFQQALVQGFDENGRARLGVLPETGHAEDDVVRLRVVAGAVAVAHHRAVAAEHFYRGGNLEASTHRFSLSREDSLSFVDCFLWINQLFHRQPDNDNR